MPRITITVPEKSLQPYRFPIERKSIVIGRKNIPEVDIVVDSECISTKHAEIVRLNGSYELRDLDSTNGIAENGVRHPVIPLKDGSKIQFGFVVMGFQLSSDEQKILEEERAQIEGPIEPPPMPVLPPRKPGVAGPTGTKALVSPQAAATPAGTKSVGPLPTVVIKPAGVAPTPAPAGSPAAAAPAGAKPAAPAGAKPAGPTPAGAKPAGPTPAGAKPAGPTAAGAKPATPAGAKPAGPTATGAKPATTADATPAPADSSPATAAAAPPVAVPARTRNILLVSGLAATILIGLLMIRYKQTTGQSVFQAIQNKVYHMTTPQKDGSATTGTDGTKPKE